MPNLDETTIIGHLGKDAVMKETSAGHVTEFSVAVNYGKKDEDGKRKTTWYNVSCWHGTAKGAEHLRKGDAVICIGHMRERKWEDKYFWSLIADHVGKVLYVKDEPGYGKDPDYHQPAHEDTEPIEDVTEDDSSIPF